MAKRRAIKPVDGLETIPDGTQPSNEPPKPKRGRGRPKGAKNWATVALETAHKLVDNSVSSEITGPLKQPKDILLESANYFWRRAEFLSNHAKKLAHEDASASTIDAIMNEAGKQLVLACKCAGEAAPYYHQRVSGPIDGDVAAYVAWLPRPAPTAEQWAATRTNPNGGH
jgi:hypothetical protein